jgi:hypothetical protein
MLSPDAGAQTINQIDSSRHRSSPSPIATHLIGPQFYVLRWNQ